MSELADFLRKLLHNKWHNPIWTEEKYAFGDTNHGFSSDWEIDYDKLSAEIDAWIAQRFNAK